MVWRIVLRTETIVPKIYTQTYTPRLSHFLSHGCFSHTLLPLSTGVLRNGNAMAYVSRRFPSTIQNQDYIAESRCTLQLLHPLFVTWGWQYGLMHCALGWAKCAKYLCLLRGMCFAHTLLPLATDILRNGNGMACRMTVHYWHHITPRIYIIMLAHVWAYGCP